MVKCTDGHSYDWNDFAEECEALKDDDMYDGNGKFKVTCTHSEIKTKAKYSQCVFMNQGWYSLQELEKIIEKLKAKKDG